MYTIYSYGFEKLNVLKNMNEMQRKIGKRTRTHVHGFCIVFVCLRMYFHRWIIHTFYTHSPQSYRHGTAAIVTEMFSSGRVKRKYAYRSSYVFRSEREKMELSTFFDAESAQVRLGEKSKFNLNNFTASLYT